MSIESFRIGDYVEDVRTKRYYLPAIQRELVWGMDRIERLFDSLLCGYPVGTMLRWKVPSERFSDFAFYDLIPDFTVKDPHNKRANLGAASECYGILDGQQRTTALFIGLCGSYTYREPRLWWNNPKAYRKATLHLDLLHQSDDEHEARYRFKFRCENDSSKESEFWFPVSKIMQIRDKDKMISFWRSTPYAESDLFKDHLAALHTAVWESHRVHFYTETRESLDEVLRIFIRLNSGGIALSYSDLLFSLVTASWKGHDAREEINALVTELNTAQGGQFNFDKDFVLRTLLVCRGGDVRFRTLNFGRQQDLEAIWPAVSNALRQAVQLLVRMGFRWETLRAPNAVLALAYYLYKLADAGAVESDRHATSREAMRLWLLRCFLGRVFQGSTDRLIAAIRDAMDQAWTSGDRAFPAQQIDAKIGEIRTAGFNDALVEQLVNDTSYGNPDAFFILSLISPAPRGHVSSFDVDHLHPRSWADKPEKLGEAGMVDTEIQFYRENIDRLANLHLLTAAENRGQKKDRALGEWLLEHPSAHWIKGGGFFPESGTDVKSFPVFFEARRMLLLAALRQALGMPPVAAVSSAGGAVPGAPFLPNE